MVFDRQALCCLRYASVWPLSLLAFRTTAHRLAFPRRPQQDPAAGRPEEFRENQSQSSMLRHVFRKHVKPKKQHEIRKLGLVRGHERAPALGARWSGLTFGLFLLPVAGEAAERADGVQPRGGRGLRTGTGRQHTEVLHPHPPGPHLCLLPQGHLTRFLAFGLGLSVTAIEADEALVATATKFDAQLVCALEKEKQKTVRLFALPLSWTSEPRWSFSRVPPRWCRRPRRPRATWPVG